MSEEMLLLGELMKLRMTDVVLKHKNFEDRYIQNIPELSNKIFSEFGKQFWQCMMFTKVESYDGRKVEVSGIRLGLFEDFRDMMLGKDNVEDYERYIIPNQSAVSAENEEPDMDYKKEIVNLISVYEDLSKTKNSNRATKYFSDLGRYHIVKGTHINNIQAAMEKAINSLGMDMRQYRQIGNSMGRQKIRLCMRESMMHNEIKIGDEVAFVIAKPNDIDIIGGRIMSIDAKTKQCNIRHEAFSNADVPFRYIISRYNEDVDYTWNGYNHCEMLLGATINDANVLLNESRQLFHEQKNAENERVDYEENNDEPQMSM